MGRYNQHINKYLLKLENIVILEILIENTVQEIILEFNQIHDDIKPENAEKLKNQAIDTDKPGLGQHYCVECARHFINNDALDIHLRGKLHKRRVKKLQEEPYTQAEADAAAGLGKPDNGKRGGRSLLTQDVAMTES
ncbi:unnamed protein product [Cunninghamella echinulata]